jgi:hypothetical protein
MNSLLKAIAWLLAAAVAFATLGPPTYRPHSDLGQNGEHALAFVLVGLAFGLAYGHNRWRTAAISAVLIGLLELLQLWVPGRHARLMDSSSTRWPPAPDSCSRPDWTGPSGAAGRTSELPGRKQSPRAGDPRGPLLKRHLRQSMILTTLRVRGSTITPRRSLTTAQLYSAWPALAAATDPAAARRLPLATTD